MGRDIPKRISNPIRSIAPAALLRDWTGGERTPRWPPRHHRRPDRPHRRSVTRTGRPGLGHRRGSVIGPGEQPPDQLGSLAEAPCLGGSRGGEVGLDPLQHPRQHHREGEEGSGLVPAEACSGEIKHSKRLLRSTAINLNEPNRGKREPTS
jgi:hypothetical protein